MLCHNTQYTYYNTVNFLQNTHKWHPYLAPGGGGGAPWGPLTLKSMVPKKGGSKVDVWAKKGSKIDFYP